MGAFEKDLDVLSARLKNGVDEVATEKLNALRDRLIQLREEKLVKINHTAMELVCAKHLILKGYELYVEHLLNGGLTCDLYGVKGYGTLVVEVETGFVPPEHALDPMTYCKARIASKIARYSNFADKFALGTPLHYVMQIPPALTMSPRYRSRKEIEEIKKLCDLYYSNPPVNHTEIINARLHTIYLIDVDKPAIQETDPRTYLHKTVPWKY